MSFLRQILGGYPRGASISFCNMICLTYLIPDLGLVKISLDNLKSIISIGITVG